MARKGAGRRFPACGDAVPSASMRRLCWLLPLLLACNVPRAEPRPIDRDAFPDEQNLLRARESLRDRVAEEREHVAALKLQLASLKADEERLYATFLEAERAYQLREKDRAGVEADLAALEKALAETQTRLQEALAQLAAAQARLAEVVTQVQAMLDTTARLEAALKDGRREEAAAILASIPPSWLPPVPAPAPPAGR